MGGTLPALEIHRSAEDAIAKKVLEAPQLARRDEGSWRMKNTRGIKGHLEQVATRINSGGDANQVFELVETVWDKFEGSGQTKMDVGKIGRDDGPKDLTWDPPDLSFTIDRHGGTVMGSTRAERQTWTLKSRNDYSNSACKWVSTAPAKFAEVGCNSNCKGHLRGGAAGSGLAIGLDRSRHSRMDG